MDCTHEFEQCVTPPASHRKWYRCTKCLTFAYRKRGKHVVYKCNAPKTGCNRNATDRLPGLGGRAFKWRCGDHGSKATP